MDAEILADLEPCGYILATNGYKYFALQCISCNEKYGHWTTFMRHLRERHLREANWNIIESSLQENEVCEKLEVELAKDETKFEVEENENAMEAEKLDTAEFTYKSGNVEISETCAILDINESDSDDLQMDCHDHLNNGTVPESIQLDSNAPESSLSECTLSDKYDDESDTEPSNKFLFNLRTKNKPTCEFIECYRQQSCLWDPESPDYYNSEERSNALLKISAFFQDNYNVILTQRRLNAAIKRLHAFYKRFCYSRRQINSIRRSYYESCAFLSGIELDDKIQITNISSNKISFGQTDPFTLGFIDLCANYPVLWDSNHQYYSIFSERKKAYDEMDQQLQQHHSVSFSKEEIYDSINRLKQYYYNIHDRERKNDPLTKSDLIYLERCKYLPACKRRVQCDICERMLRSDTTLQVHLLKEHNVGQLPLKCGYCELRFANRHGLREHEVRAHTKDFEWFCQHCNKGFASRRDMETHELVHTGERNCICEQCGKGFRLKQQMKEHVRVVHERVRQYKCSMCPKDYLRKTHLEDHIRGHLNIRDKICPTCGKAFTNFHSLFRHKQLHSEVKRYLCKVCGDRFHQFVGLNGHMKRKHKIVKDPNAIVEPTSTETTSEAPAREA